MNVSILCNSAVISPFRGMNVSVACDSDISNRPVINYTLKKKLYGGRLSNIYLTGESIPQDDHLVI
ncbi:hypothetical protein MPTK1_6g10140 [Marchantia polymorpha subsp. ruderalis]|uniref:Uncharacterized protein n=2 Tax=Marchantia polymorpha TaxID=3197 RepID=A0AAF6BQH3_MARPO|nr:hypothetical protein MARPO_0016s0057 [Marchantia polymorpha]PTQ44993.1 hypothetical protein MARPO_0016s0057 [Marchantia polymorpha]BBN14257.1 hypothetical protein Mp_6g10140 [Marchantia polymorpha subsp. ruderalis]BBN14258.1 hypothetical protein Mp_6g10140 [Marchantia polymorpha subsp. ruderalis]|eukprot:PTQ44992.1 hypothetical protein MARPO_0016s0057 [Marchantia polymorpha]